MPKKSKYNKLISFLQFYGEWVNDPIPELGYPSHSAAFSDRNMDKRYTPPSWLKNSPKAIRSVLMHFFTKRESTKPQVKGKTPSYMPHHYMNEIKVQVDQLPDEQKRIIELRYVECLTTEDISIKTKLTHDQIKKRSGKAYRYLYENINFVR